MNAPLDPSQLQPSQPDHAISLDDKWTLERGRAFMTGTQALIRLPMLQRERDVKAGLNTAGYITGYRGSPVTAVDQTAMKAKKHLDAHHVKFHPGMNEDLAATAVWGTQQTNLYKDANYDGVFAMWYGKGPGVDRCGDVFKHGNNAGSSQHGGVLVLAGDDHAAKSSSTAHQSDHILTACGIPVLYPSSVQEYIDYGLHAWAMSRYTGLWVSMKCVTDVIESGAVVDLDPDRVQTVIPTDFEVPEGGLNIRWPDAVLDQEVRMNNHKWYAALAYARANKLNKIIWDSPMPKIGIITAGKSYVDTRQALADLGIDEQAAADIGIRLYKIGMTWPLESEGVHAFARGLDEILVVEEKRQVMEYALKEALYNLPDGERPRVVGKFDDTGEWSNKDRKGHGDWLLPATYELNPAQIARAIASRITHYCAGHPVAERVRERIAFLEAKELVLKNIPAKANPETDRIPYFCSGCPHNSSTKVPEGSRAMAGIGCHYMVLWMDRETSTFTHMGAEGTTWIGQSPFTSEKHVFVNLGDGTYFHSGILAVRASVAAKVNITYKILYNDAVAMTGGQNVDGPLDPGMITRQIAAEGVKPIIVVTDEPDKYPSDYAWAEGVTVRHRSELMDVQKELREMPGVSAVIYDQTCASEKRRRRKKGEFPDPAKRAVINEAVCEGCGDCSVQSNCLSVEPLETELGRKRQINQSSCNKDFSCVSGFCPSFVTVEGGTLKKNKAGVSKGDDDGWGMLPEPVLPSVEHPYNILINGIGGTGVITVGALMGMAAHLEAKGASVLDMTGMSQKNGSVTSHVKIAATPERLRAQRIATGEADLVLGCDMLTTGAADAISKMRPGRTLAIVNLHEQPTGTFAQNADWQFPAEDVRGLIVEAVGGACGVDFVDATKLATALMGDSIATNLFLMGYAWQKGRIPLTEASLMRAIELNGVAVASNKKSFLWGRRAAVDFKRVERTATPTQAVLVQMPQSLDNVIKKRVEFLTGYQDAAYAGVYLDLVERVRAAETSVSMGNRLSMAVAKYYFKLMAYKDEYEVARLYTDGRFLESVKSQFEGDVKLKFNLAPPMFAKKNAKGELVKREFGGWMLGAFKLLTKLKGLRGGAFDVFGYTAERKMERALIAEYRQMIEALLPSLTAVSHADAVELASLPEQIRGFGHVKEKAVDTFRLRKAELLSGNVKRRAA